MHVSVTGAAAQGPAHVEPLPSQCVFVSSASL